MKKHVLFIATAAAMLAGCAKEVEKPVEEQTMKLYTITALVDNPETRTVTQYNSETNKYKFSWSENETISVVSVNPSEILPFQVSNTASGIFTYQSSKTYDGFGMAVTPADALVGNPTPSNFTVQLSGTYNYGQSNALMIAGEPSKNGNNYKFQFKHAAALVQVTYNDIPAGTKAMVLTATETGKVITGSTNLTSATDPVAMSSLTGTTSNEARVNYASALTSAKSSDVFYVPIPTGSYKTFEIKLVDGSDHEISGSKFVIDAGASVNVTVGNVLMFPAKAVTSSQIIPDGAYAIALLNESHLNRDIMMKAKSGDDNQGYMTLTTSFDENGKLSVPPVAAWILEYDSATSSYSIKSMSENKYLEGRAGAAYLGLVDNAEDKSKFHITSEGKDSDGNNLYRISVKSTTEERWIGFNYANGSGLFRTYENNTNFEEVLCLIPASSGLTPSLTFPNETKTVHADATSITFEYVAQNLTKNPVVSITSNDFDVVTSATVDAGNNQVVVNLTPNTDTAEKTATLTVSCEGVEDVLLTVIQSGKTGNVVDVITKALTGVSGTSYYDWNNKKAPNGSDAVYAGNSAGGNNADDLIQLRSKNSSGIISTTSGGKVKTVTIIWDQKTESGSLDIYGKNTAYESPSDLYDSSTQGTKLGSITYGSQTTTLTISSDYEYIGLRSHSGAIYISQIAIEWQPQGGATPTLQYTLDGTITATGNNYAAESDVTQNSIAWKVCGNTEQNPWRIGGKNITDQDRAIYSTVAILPNISQIKVTSGATASGLSVNSLTISVHSSATDAASGDNAIATKTVSSGIASSTVTFDKADNTSWAGKFYRIVYNVTRTSTSNNGYITFENAEFYGTN